MTEPIRKSTLPTTPPPEWEITTVGGKTGAVIRRQVSFGDWEPVLPDHWADEPADARDTARTASGQQPESAPCGDTGACNGGPCAHPAAAPWTADGRHGPTPAEIADARIPTCYVQFVGGAHCTKPFGHRPPGSDDPHTPEPAPAVGQPAEAQAADRAAVLREAIEAAEGELLHDDTRTPEDEAYNQGVRDAAAAIACLAVEDETR